jgi:Spy/CpxP family protein refolding chaperone
MGPRFGRFGDEGDADRPPPFLMDLTLSEDQQDKVFAILHAAAPALRDQDKALRKARDAMRELVRSAQFNDGSAATLSQAQGKAASQLALLRTRVEHDIYSLLTADQQAQIVNRERDWQSHRREAPHPRS